MNLALLVERLGGAIVVTHSQSGIMGHHMARVLIADILYNWIGRNVRGTNARRSTQ